MPGWLELANDRFYLINSAVFQHESKIEEFLFFIFQSVGQANTVNMINMNALPLLVFY
jgi:hypothetical protein